MAFTRTLPVDLRKLDRQGDEGALVVLLMMACNDLVALNKALGSPNEEHDKTDSVRRGEGMYFVRLQLSHLNEAVDLVRDVKNYPELLKIISECPDWTEHAFSKLLSYGGDGANAQSFLKYVEIVRHKTFHYDRGIVRAALKDRAARRGRSAHFVTTADDVSQVRFRVADDVFNTLICHKIWGIPPGADTAAEADKILDFGFEIFKTFLQFASTLVERYVVKHALFER